MTTLYFVNPGAERHVMTVAAVDGGRRLVAGKSYRVDDSLVDGLLATGDWGKTKPGESTPQVTVEAMPEPMPEVEPVATGRK